MESWSFPDDNVANLVESRRIDSLPDANHRLQLHSSLIQRLALEEVMELKDYVTAGAPLKALQGILASANQPEELRRAHLRQPISKADIS